MTIWTVLTLAIFGNSSVSDYCAESLKKFPGRSDAKLLAKACSRSSVLENCESVNKQTIFHYEKTGNHRSNQRILVFSLIHGNETPAGTAGRLWMERLESIEPRNTWRVIPILNPDGVKNHTRTNANKIDLNRNFPTKDWTEKAQSYWKKQGRGSPRLFPGNESASEPETRCAIKHLEDFKPDMIVSIHTPLKVLDYDGPSVKPPRFDYLPWRNLGHYPGSLGRYMWFERKVPVLTMELKEDLPPQKPIVELQDIIGFLVSLELGKTKEVMPVTDKDEEALQSSPKVTELNPN